MFTFTKVSATVLILLLKRVIKVEGVNETIERFSNIEFHDAFDEAKVVTQYFIGNFLACVSNDLRGKEFEDENPMKLINKYPMKTTVGFAPDFTSNRKFFTNMISTVHFKKMLQEDKEAIWQSFIRKHKFCDDVIMDQSVLKDMFVREVDQNKI